MRKFFLNCIAQLVLLTAATTVTAQTGIGSGGDAIRRLFEDARWAASLKVSQLSACSFDEQTPSQSAEWLSSMRDQISNDIRNSNHLWTVDPLPTSTCAYTSSEPGADLFLSYPTCIQSTQTLNQAIFVVLHEAMHHFGVSDESQADRLATMIVNADIDRECPMSPEDPFHPQYCQGPELKNRDLLRFFAPGQSEVDIGQFQLAAKSRFCNPLTGCTDWATGKLSIADGDESMSTYSIRLGIRDEGTNVMVLGSKKTSGSSRSWWYFWRPFNPQETMTFEIYPAHVQYHPTWSIEGRLLFVNGHSEPIAPSGKFRTNCAKFDQILNVPGNSASGNYEEVHLVLHGRY